MDEPKFAIAIRFSSDCIVLQGGCNLFVDLLTSYFWVFRKISYISNFIIGSLDNLSHTLIFLENINFNREENLLQFCYASIYYSNETIFSYGRYDSKFFVSHSIFFWTRILVITLRILYIRFADKQITTF